MATTKKQKNWNKRTVRIYSRHPSHNSIRKNILVPVLSVLRLGSTTEWDKSEYELNSIESVQNSSSKLKMKQCFDEANVKTAPWWKSPIEIDNLEEKPKSIIAKKIFGSRGEGMKKFDTYEEFLDFVNNNPNVNKYIFEEYKNYTREYRLHVDANGCFYTCRKMLKSDTPEENKWFRNDSNCVWYLEENENFDRPTNWDEIVAECVKALNATGLDIGACDVRVQGAKNSKGQMRENPEFIIVEINSAPSFGEITEEKYAERIPYTLSQKYNL